MSLSDYGIIVLTETWLNDEIYNNELGLNNFNVFRQDRDQIATGKSRGGGVLFAVKSNFKASLMQAPHKSPFHEEIWVKTMVNGFLLIFCVVYFPPQSKLSEYENHANNIEHFSDLYECNSVFILGDYNLPNFNDFNSLEGDTYTYNQLLHGPTTECLIAALCFSNLAQANTVPNNRNVFLDLIFTNKCDLLVETAHDILVSCDSHHPALIFDVDLNGSTFVHQNNVEFQYNFKNYDFSNLNHILLNINWDPILDCDIDMAVDRFYDIINQCIEEFVPKYKVKSAFKFPIWFDQELKNYTIEKKKCHKLYKSKPTLSNYQRFKELRTICKSLSQNCYRSYINKLEQSIKSNVRAFWSYIDSKKDKGTILKLMKTETGEFSNDTEIADVFAEHFASVYVENDPDVSDTKLPLSTNNITVSSFNFSISNILEKLEKINLNQGPGPDNLPPLLLKNCAFSLSRPLWLLFNNSIKNGKFPSTWKLTYVRPIYKNIGSKNEVKNYRPISSISLIPKIMEHTITEFLEQNFTHLIIPNQHGFLKQKSIQTNMLTYIDFIYNNLENGFEVDSVYTDFSKGFDKINHSLLLKKLYYYGISGNLLNWLDSFLTNRTQIVKINNTFSKPFRVTSGVPQGGHLSPFLFNIFINDVKSCFKFSEFALYADDLKVYKAITTEHCANNLQIDLNNFHDWCILNRMFLNVEKCKFIKFTRSLTKKINSYHINNNRLAQVDIIKDLGVLVDSKLCFSYHIDDCRNKALRTLGFIKRNTRDFDNILVIKLLYTALVRPHLENCSIIWNPYYSSYIDKLDSVQRKFLRYVAYKLHLNVENLNYGNLEQILSIQSLKRRRDNIDIITCFKLVNNTLNCPELVSKLQFCVPQRIFRKGRTFETNFHRTLYGYYSPMSRLMRNTNSFEGDIFAESLFSLKTKLKRL